MRCFYFVIMFVVLYIYYFLSPFLRMINKQQPVQSILLHELHNKVYENLNLYLYSVHALRAFV